MDLHVEWDEFPGRNVAGDTPAGRTRWRTIRGRASINGIEHAMEASIVEEEATPDGVAYVKAAILHELQLAAAVGRE